MSVDELMDRARPMAAAGVPSKNAIKKNLRVSWDKAVEVHDLLSREVAEAARARATQRRSKLRRGPVQETTVRRLRAPRTVSPPVPVSPVVQLQPVEPSPQITLRAGEAAAPPIGLFHGPFPLPAPPPAVAPARSVAGRSPGEAPPRRVHSWPLLLLALPAFVAIWSGWVGLGGLTGFGEVHPLPGIADSVKLDTAITLPIGLETYAAYALYVWLGSGAVGWARTFAMWSAVCSLALGAAGQVAFHLMTAYHMASAPWLITTIVACLPVAVVGMGAALYHLVHAEEVSS